MVYYIQDSFSYYMVLLRQIKVTGLLLALYLWQQPEIQNLFGAKAIQYSQQYETTK
jgi:hypothetical protein